MRIQTTEVTPSLERPKTSPTAVIPPGVAPPKALSDQFATQNNKVLSTSAKQPIVSRVDLKLTDRDGLANLGEHDLQAQVSGEILINPDFLLGQLGQLKSDEDKKFNAPTFDAERKQYVISGKALNKILGLINVGFEIRLGVYNGQLAFQVDSGIKRGSIYGELEQMLAKQGLTTEVRDKHLYIKPDYKKTIELPGVADKTARIDSIKATPENLTFEISANGQIKVNLKDVPLELSSQAGKTNPIKVTPDAAEIKFDLALDDKLHPQVTIQDGNITAHTTPTELEPYLKAKGSHLLTEQLGTALTVGVSGLHGSVVKGTSGLEMHGGGQVSLANQDQSTLVKTTIEAKQNQGKALVTAQKSEVRLASGVQVTATKVTYDGQQPGMQIQVEDVDGQVRQDGIAVTVADLTGSVTKDTAGIFQAKLQGKTNGTIDKQGIQTGFSTTGNHQVTVAGSHITASVSQAQVGGHYRQPTETANPVTKTKTGSSPTLDITVNQIAANGSLTTDAAEIQIDANGGEIQVHVGPEQDLTVKTTAQVNISAQGEKLNGKATLHGADVQQNAAGLKIQLPNADAQGHFAKPGKLAVDGQVSGHIAVSVSPAGQVHVDTREGQFNAKIAVKDKIKVTGKGKNASFAIDKQDNLQVVLEKMAVTTEVTANKTRIKAQTTGANASVSVLNDDVTVTTSGTTSQLDVKVKEILHGSGTTGDVKVTVDTDDAGDDIQITAQKADVTARIINKKGNLNVGVDTKADINVHVNRQENVTVSSKKAKSNVAVSLKSPDGQQQKIAVKAQGTDFNVAVKDDDVAIDLQESNFDGQITPNPRIAVGVGSTTSSPMRVTIDESETATDIQVKSAAAVKGHVRVKDKVNADFQNPSGFEVHVKDQAEGTDIHTQLKQLGVKGQVKTPDTQVGVDGQGDFDLKVIKDDDVQVRYDGKLLGDIKAKDQVAGDYGVTGQVQVDIHGSDVDVNATGQVAGQFKSKAHGIGANIQVNGQKQPIRVQIKDNQLQVSVKEGGEIQLRDIPQLKLGQPDPKLTEVLGKLESKEVKVTYQDLEIHAQGKTASVKLQSDQIATFYGNVDTHMNLEKSGEHVQIKDGWVGYEPNIEFYNLIQEKLNEKYNIKISGKPSFENGEIKVKGELRSKIGLVQWADFNIKATVVDNKLVFDLDKARVLKISSKNTLGNVANKILSKTDIDVFRKDPGTIEIALADIVKDLSLTEGVNFTDLKLVENHFEVGFRYNSQDQDVAKLAKQKDLNGLKQFLAAQPLTQLSGESLSTAYNALVTQSDTAAAGQLLTDLIQAYGQTNPATTRHELERALLWISKSQPARKQDVNDDIALSVLRQLKLETPTGQKLVRQLPLAVVENLANNLDQTLSQGAGWSWITQEERQLANQLRELKGLPLNQRVI